MVGFSYGFSPNRSKTRPFKIRIIQNGRHLSGFQMVGLPGSRSYSKSGSFATNLFLTIQNPDYSIFQIPTGPNTWNLDSSEIPNKSAVQISLFGMFAIQIPTALIFLMIFKMVLASQNF